MAMLQTLRFNLATTACLYLTAIVLLSLQGSLVSSAVVSLIGVGCLAYYFAPPIYSFRFDDPFNGTRTAGIISRIRSPRGASFHLAVPAKVEEHG